MGRIQIRDRSREWEITTGSLDGSIELELGDEEELEVMVSDRTPYTPNDVVVTEREDDHETSWFGDGPAWLLYVPTLLGSLALVVDELQLLNGVFPEIGWALVVGLYMVFYLFAGVGTLFLYNDAEQLAASNRAWQPNPWVFIGTGAIGFTAIQAALLDLPSDLATLLPSMAGVLLVGCIAGTAITGPVYLALRQRNLDEAGPLRLG